MDGETREPAGHLQDSLLYLLLLRRFSLLHEGIRIALPQSTLSQAPEFSMVELRAVGCSRLEHRMVHGYRLRYRFYVQSCRERLESDAFNGHLRNHQCAMDGERNS